MSRDLVFFGAIAGVCVGAALAGWALSALIH